MQPISKGLVGSNDSEVSARSNVLDENIRLSKLLIMSNKISEERRIQAESLGQDCLALALKLENVLELRLNERVAALKNSHDSYLSNKISECNAEEESIKKQIEEAKRDVAVMNAKLQAIRDDNLQQAQPSDIIEKIEEKALKREQEAVNIEKKKFEKALAEESRRRTFAELRRHLDECSAEKEKLEILLREDSEQKVIKNKSSKITRDSDSVDQQRRILLELERELDNGTALEHSVNDKLRALNEKIEITLESLKKDVLQTTELLEATERKNDLLRQQAQSLAVEGSAMAAMLEKELVRMVEENMTQSQKIHESKKSEHTSRWLAEEKSVQDKIEAVTKDIEKFNAQLNLLRAEGASKLKEAEITEAQLLGKLADFQAIQRAEMLQKETQAAELQKLTAKRNAQISEFRAVLQKYQLERERLIEVLGVEKKAFEQALASVKQNCVDVEAQLSSVPNCPSSDGLKSESQWDEQVLYMRARLILALDELQGMTAMIRKHFTLPGGPNSELTEQSSTGVDYGLRRSEMASNTLSSELKSLLEGEEYNCATAVQVSQNVHEKNRLRGDISGDNVKDPDCTQMEVDFLKVKLSAARAELDRMSEVMEALLARRVADADRSIELVAEWSSQAHESAIEKAVLEEKLLCFQKEAMDLKLKNSRPESALPPVSKGYKDYARSEMPPTNASTPSCIPSESKSERALKFAVRRLEKEATLWELHRQTYVDILNEYKLQVSELTALLRRTEEELLLAKHRESLTEERIEPAENGPEDHSVSIMITKRSAAQSIDQYRELVDELIELLKTTTKERKSLSSSLAATRSSLVASEERRFLLEHKLGTEGRKRELLELELSALLSNRNRSAKFAADKAIQKSSDIQQRMIGHELEEIKQLLEDKPINMNVERVLKPSRPNTSPQKIKYRPKSAGVTHNWRSKQPLEPTLTGSSQPSATYDADKAIDKESLSEPLTSNILISESSYSSNQHLLPDGPSKSPATATKAIRKQRPRSSITYKSQAERHRTKSSSASEAQPRDVLSRNGNIYFGGGGQVN